MRTFRTFSWAAIAAVLWSLLGPVPALAHGGEDHTPAAASAAGAVTKVAPNAATHATPNALLEGPQRLADGSLFVPKSAQRRLAIRTVQVQVAELMAGVELNGTVQADPQSSGRIQAPFSGSVQPGPKGMPVGGRQVRQGEVLAYLQPVASAIEQGNQKAQLAELDAQLAMAERKVARYAQLEGVVPQKDIEAARIEREALRQRRSFVSASVDSALPLRAPVSGVLSASGHLQAGQIVDARELLFEIVDPARLVVEALAYEPGLLGSVHAASMQVGEGGAGGAGGEGDGRTLALAFLGGGRQLRAQALPLLFRIVQPEPTLVVGQPVKVVVRTQRGIRGAAVPLRALSAPGAGQSMVWVHAAPERFVRRQVRTQPLDAQNSAVVEGLQDGERVVTDGASLLSQVR